MLSDVPSVKVKMFEMPDCKVSPYGSQLAHLTAAHDPGAQDPAWTDRYIVAEEEAVLTFTYNRLDDISWEICPYTVAFHPESDGIYHAQYAFRAGWCEVFLYKLEGQYRDNARWVPLSTTAGLGPCLDEEDLKLLRRQRRWGGK